MNLSGNSREDEYVAKLALDIKMREYQITEAQFKCIMYQVSEMVETVNESSVVSASVGCYENDYTVEE